MPIHHSDGGTTLTGDSITFYQIAAQRGAVSLELKGIRMSRGPVLWKRLRDHYQIPGIGKRKATAVDVLNWLDAKVEELRPQQEHITKTPDGRTIREVGGQEVQ
jgi:hypothetical protein